MSAREQAGTPAESSVVVGVDGTELNRAAVAYATSEAASSGRQLVLVAAIDYGDVGFESSGTVTTYVEDVLDEAGAQARQDHPAMPLQTRVRFGHPVGTLLDQVRDGDEIVVGKRGLGAIRRMLVGSTSIRVAGRAEVPVIVVPGDWSAATRPATAPIVVGIDPDRAHDDPLEFAFRQAERTGASVHVVHAADLELVLVWGAGAVATADVHDWEVRSVASIEAAVKPFREDHPDVPVEIIKDRGHAAGVLLAHAAEAQLVVLGRRHRGPASWGLGSVAREVMHEAEVPVAIVPLSHH